MKVIKKASTPEEELNGIIGTVDYRLGEFNRYWEMFKEYKKSGDSNFNLKYPLEMIMKDLGWFDYYLHKIILDVGDYKYAISGLSSNATRLIFDALDGDYAYLNHMIVISEDKIPIVEETVAQHNADLERENAQKGDHEWKAPILTPKFTPVSVNDFVNLRGGHI